MDEKRIAQILKDHGPCPSTEWRDAPDCHDAERSGCAIRELVAEVRRLRASEAARAALVEERRSLMLGLAEVTDELRGWLWSYGNHSDTNLVIGPRVAFLKASKLLDALLARADGGAS